MTFHLDIADSIAHSIRLPLPEVELHVRSELAIALNSRGILSGKASGIAGVSLYTFADLIRDRHIPRHHREDDLRHDLDYARGQ